MIHPLTAHDQWKLASENYIPRRHQHPDAEPTPEQLEQQRYDDENTLAAILSLAIKQVNAGKTPDAEDDRDNVTVDDGAGRVRLIVKDINCTWGGVDAAQKLSVFYQVLGKVLGDCANAWGKADVSERKVKGGAS